MSLNNNFNIHRLERMIILSYSTKAKPVVILSKSDLVSNVNDYINDVKKILPDLDVIATSIITKEGIDEINKYLVYPNCILLIGASGVGKSSIINEIVHNNILKTGEIRDKDDRGRHTTVTRKMILLDNGCKIVDTPGIRSFGMINITDSIQRYYSDVVQIIEKCKFKNCTHHNEPGCAIREALENKTL